ncbi:MAG: M23 family peptidase, partial [Alphaproteobacteria bacterium]|nr:M23 family peptidase [Alphaproteobacteria bacterium]
MSTATARLPLALAVLAAALALTACDPKTPAPADAPPKPPSADPGPPKAEDEPVDGGAEQQASEPLPPSPGPPVQPAEPPAPSPASFEHNPPGQLPAGQGSGYLDRTVWSPAMCWPLMEAGFANSQVYGAGGGMGPAGHPSQCDSLNYTLPWRDNFCEARSRTSPLCGSGT